MQTARLATTFMHANVNVRNGINTPEENRKYTKASSCHHLLHMATWLWGGDADGDPSWTSRFISN